MNPSLDFYEVVYKRSAIRKFRHVPVPDDAVRRILEAGIHAPSPENKQPWEFILIRRSELRAKLADLKYQSRKRMAKVLYPDMSEEKILEMAKVQRIAVETAAVLIAVCYRDLDNLTEIGQRRISLSHTAAWQCIQNMWLAATAEGLGFSPTFYAGDVYEEARRLLGLPPRVELAAIVRVGNKDQKLKRKPLRPLEEKLHYDRF